MSTSRPWFAPPPAFPAILVFPYQLSTRLVILSETRATTERRVKSKDPKDKDETMPRQGILTSRLAQSCPNDDTAYEIPNIVVRTPSNSVVRASSFGILRLRA